MKRYRVGAATGWRLSIYNCRDDLGNFNKHSVDHIFAGDVFVVLESEGAYIHRILSAAKTGWTYSSQDILDSWEAKES